MLNMTELKEAKEEINALVKAGKITKADAKAWLKVEKALMGKCYGCKYNDFGYEEGCFDCEKN